MLILQYSTITFSSPVNIGPCLDLWRPWSALYSTHAPRFGLRAQGQPYAVVEAPASGLQTARMGRHCRAALNDGAQVAVLGAADFAALCPGTAPPCSCTHHTSPQS